jgi:hypothetical protein
MKHCKYWDYNLINDLPTGAGFLLRTVVHASFCFRCMRNLQRKGDQQCITELCKICQSLLLWSSKFQTSMLITHFGGISNPEICGRNFRPRNAPRSRQCRRWAAWSSACAPRDSVIYIYIYVTINYNNVHIYILYYNHVYYIYIDNSYFRIYIIYIHRTS